MRCPLDFPSRQATLRAVNCILILFAAAVFGTGAATIGTGPAQPPASGLQQWLEHRAVVVPVSPDRLVTGRASSQRYPSNPEGVACPLQWLPLFLAGSPLPPARHRRLLDNIFTSKAELETAVQAFNANSTSAIATYGPIADWNVSAITDMSELFMVGQDTYTYDDGGGFNVDDDGDGLDFNADISNWETSSVTDMSYMFSVRSSVARRRLESASEGASAFNQRLSFDTSSVKDMQGMFYVRSSPCPAPNLQPHPLLHLRAPRSSTACYPPTRTTPPPRIYPPFDSAGRDGVQPAAEL